VASMNVASDLEGTLTTGRTWKGVGMYLQMHGYAAQYRLFLAPHLLGTLVAQMGIINKQEYQNQWIVDLSQLLKGFDQARIDTMSEWVVDHVMWPQRRADVLAELQHLRAEGHRAILTSGAYQPIAQAFARRAGLSDAIGTPLQFSAGKATGHIEGALNNKDVKAERLRAYLGTEALDIAYGDTSADIPMLQMCRAPIAVYPDKELRAAAIKNGWRILESR